MCLPCSYFKILFIIAFRQSPVALKASGNLLCYSIFSAWVFKNKSRSFDLKSKMQNSSLHSCGSRSVHAAASCSCVFVVVIFHPSIKRLPVITLNLIFKKKKVKVSVMLLNSAQQKKTKPRVGFFLYDGLFVAMCHKCLYMFLVASISLSYFDRL